MWLVKGVLLGVVIFIVGGILYTVIRVRIVMHRLAQTYKTDTMFVGFKVGALLHDPVVWGVLFVSIAIGIWIVRARMRGATSGGLRGQQPT
jgi:cell division protein FtsX